MSGYSHVQILFFRRYLLRILMNCPPVVVFLLLYEFARAWLKIITVFFSLMKCLWFQVLCVFVKN